MTTQTTLYRSPPIQPGVAPDPNYLMRDLDLQFTAMIRNASAVSSWHTRFAYMPSTPFASGQIDLPVDLSSFGFSEWTGTPTFRKGSNTKIRQQIAPFWEGTKINVRELADPNSNALIGFEQRANALMMAWQRFLPPRIYTLLKNGQSDSIVSPETSNTHPVTGASHFFATDHYCNVDKPDYGQFANLIGDGGDLASEPIYAVLGGGVFDLMKPWSILTGSNLDRERTAGGRAGGGGGMPWVIHWEAATDAQLFDLNFERRMGVYAEKGYGLLFPHSILRYEGTLDYAGLKSLLDAARSMKDLNGYMPADQTYIAAFLCGTTAQASEINGILGRDITDTASTGRKIDPALKSAEVIVMSR